MPGNAFIKFTNSSGGLIKGESMQDSHPSEKGWLEINDWSWDIESETNYLKGTGAAVGVATPGTFSFSHTFDKSSPEIMKNIVMGTSFKTATVHMLKATGASDGKPEVFFGLKMGDAFVVKVSSKAGEDGAISQDVEFVFKAISMAYKRQDNNGKLVHKETQEFGWNIATKESKAPSEIVVALDPAKD
ncbi:type VI secretion system tube protein Hcp [Pelomonas sp. KK5]|uniref:Hcp family type VI secretion system effector n=1 Tax=Pelomonas sp. KK5 TaxID=1855730 RepID=UPI00097C80DB|nr:type VI secretion system tube protein Hcp [Pelomonas sp. KK5]